MTPKQLALFEELCQLVLAHFKDSRAGLDGAGQNAQFESEAIQRLEFGGWSGWGCRVPIIESDAEDVTDVGSS